MCNNRNCCRCGGGRNNPCSPNPRCEEFSRVVATWQTVRHYKVTSHDTIRPVCTRGLDNTDFQSCIGGGRGSVGGSGSGRGDGGEEGNGCGCDGGRQG